MNFFYVIAMFDDDCVTYGCKTMREAREVASTKRAMFPKADIIITKAIYSELKVRVEV